MKLPTVAPEQRVVRGILHQGVLESVFGVGWRAAPEDQLGACELFEGFIQFLQRHMRNGAN